MELGQLVGTEYNLWAVLPRTMGSVLHRSKI